ncbi:MAG: lamin tail domain-containing protein [Alphaproteobacteria bacterium]|nr:lamin tail domain-containing protein [Alphaproteobacteria bacterium]
MSRSAIPAILFSVTLFACSSEPSVQTVDPEGTLVADVAADGLVVRDEGAAWSVTMALGAFGREGDTSPAEAGEMQSGERVTVARPGITEWYVAKGPALEQGFDIASKPSGVGPVTIELVVSGDLQPWMGPGGVRFASDNGNVQMMYDSLEVYDDRGETLASWMGLDCTGADCVITLSFDDTEAVYPVVVDPIFYDTNTILNPAVGFAAANDADDVGWDIAIDGTTAIVGIPQADDPFGAAQVGMAVVYDFNAGVWSQRSQLWGDAPFGAVANGHAGWSVDVSNNVFVVGAPDIDEVYVFVAPSGAAVFGATQTLSAGPNDDFGYAVALDAAGDTLIVGAPRAGTGSNRGEAYVYDAGGGTFALEDTLSDGTAPNNNERFGAAVDISADGQSVVVGAPGNQEAVSGDASGGVFYFTDPAGGTIAFTQQQIIEATDLEAGAAFGFSVDLNGTGLGVGAPGADVPLIGVPTSIDAGAAFAYLLNAGTWGLDGTFTAPVVQASSNFGTDVAIASDRLVVGHPNATAWSGQATGGKVWVFNDPGTDAWVLNQEVGQSTAASLSAGENFGRSVALGTSLFVGAPDRPDTSSPGPGVFVLDGFEADFDNDGYLTDAIETGGLCGGIACDCNDADSAINPGAVEDETDAVDEDCDGFLADCNTFNGSCAPFNIVVTEIMANPVSTDDEWIEIHNTSATKAVDLAGMFIRADNQAHTVADNLLIKPGDYVVLINDAANAGTTVYNTEVIPGAGPVTAAYYYDTVVLPDTTATTTPLSLLSATAAIDMDIVDYDATFSTGTATPDGATFSLDPDFMTDVANNTATFWCDGRTSFGDAGQLGTPGAVNDDCDYTFNLSFLYTNNMGDPDVTGSTTFTFSFDATSRWGASGNGADFTFTRTTTDPGGQSLVVQYADFVGGGAGVTYLGNQPFGDDCVPGGTITNIPNPDFDDPGAWVNLDCP